MKFDADVVVVGAGPSGAALSAKLAAAGVDTLLLDRANFPREKVCGDFVGPKALAELEALGVPDAEIQATNLIRRASLAINGQKLNEYHLRALDGRPNYGRVIPRIRLDAMILEAARRAGARLQEGVAATDFNSSGGAGEVMVRTGSAEGRLRARVVVGADGSASVVARSLRGGRHPRADTSIAIRGYAEGPVRDLDRCDICFSGDTFPGYYWVFPVGERAANVGIGTLAETTPPVGRRLQNLLHARMEADPVLRDRLAGCRISGKVAGWPLATYSPSLRLAGDNVILLGDAAGLINPINGDGIQNALMSARWAAPIILNCLRSNSLSRQGLVAYEETVGRELGADLTLARQIVQTVANRALTPLWLLSLRSSCRAARTSEYFDRVAGAVLSGAGNASDLLSPQILTQSAISLIEEVASEGLGLLPGGSAALRSSHFNLTERMLRSAGLLARRDPEPAMWLGRLLAATLRLGAEVAKSTNVRR
jgi:geranylgeranyl reductase family protein